MANSHFSSFRIIYSGLNFGSMKPKLFALALLLPLYGCAGGMNILPPSTVHAANPLEVLRGKYHFVSRGPFVNETGFAYFDGKGHFTIHSQFSNVDFTGSINTAGHYTLNSAGSGIAAQGACRATDLSCPTLPDGDKEALFVSSDGAKAYMTRIDGKVGPWAAEFTRDPQPFTSDLTNCDATSGVVKGCDDGWLPPEDF